jgi:phosphatidate cytidylyltransferase
MSSLWSRILVTALLLPLALGVVWLGGWWLLTLAAAAALLALHEFYSMTRALRPLVLAGYVGTLAALLGEQLGGLDWMLGGFMATFLFAFLLNGVAETRAPATVAVGSTVLGAGWIALGLGCILLLRGIPDHGRLAAFAVLLSVFAADTVAYSVGRLFGRHKLAPAVSPGKTWEGFVAGSVAGIFVSFISLYRSGFADGWRSVVLGIAVVFAAGAGDLFESALKRDMKVKDTGRLLGGHGGVLDRLDSLLFAGAAGYFVLRAFGY